MTGTRKDRTRKCRLRSVGGNHGGTQKVRLVVVHGIGSQKPGATAARWADGIVRFARAAGHRTEVTSADLTGSPARLTVHLTPPADVPDQAPPTSQIDIEEAYWADSFPEPSLGRVLRFLLTVAPVLAITQSILIWRSRDTLLSGRWRPAQAVGQVTALVGPLALAILALGIAAPVIAVLLLLLLLASSLPIPAVRRAVGKTLGWLTTSIGDAYLFVADPVNRAAMQARLAQRLAERSDVPPARTVVLAHSQGAALAYRALGAMPLARRPAALVTVGSGVGRLHEVGLLQTLPWYLTPLFAAVVASAATGVALAAWPATALLLVVASLLGVLAWRICARWLDEPRTDLDEAARAEAERRTRGQELLDPVEGMSWLDIWATFDLVPNGRTARDTGDSHYQLARVAGEQSPIRDHIRYELDWDQTMPLVFARLLDPSGRDRIPYIGVRPYDKDPEGLPREPSSPLAWRDRIGLLLRAVPLGAIAGVLWWYRGDLFTLGHWLRTAPPGFLDSTVDAVFVPLRGVSDFLDATWVRAPRPQELLGVLALLVLGLTGSVLVRRLLTFFQRRETTGWLEGKGLDLGSDGPRWKDRKWGKTQLGRARWPLALSAVAVVASPIPLLLYWAVQESHWTARQTVEAYLTAVAEDDPDALCDVTIGAVTARPVDGSPTADVCGTGDQSELRTCGDARKAVAALEEDAYTVTKADGAVAISWDPEVAVQCDNPDHWLALPCTVEFVDDDEGRRRWQVTAATPPPEPVPG